MIPRLWDFFDVASRRRALAAPVPPQPPVEEEDLGGIVFERRRRRRLPERIRIPVVVEVAGHALASASSEADLHFAFCQLASALADTQAAAQLHAGIYATGEASARAEVQATVAAQLALRPANASASVAASARSRTVRTLRAAEAQGRTSMPPAAWARYNESEVLALLGITTEGDPALVALVEA